jgi:hypothetical protein
MTAKKKKGKSQILVLPARRMAGLAPARQKTTISDQTTRNWN